MGKAVYRERFRWTVLCDAMKPPYRDVGEHRDDRARDGDAR
jgi:hypothetical protein